MEHGRKFVSPEHHERNTTIKHPLRSGMTLNYNARYGTTYNYQAMTASYVWNDVNLLHEHCTSAQWPQLDARRLFKSSMTLDYRIDGQPKFYQTTVPTAMTRKSINYCNMVWNDNKLLKTVRNDFKLSLHGFKSQEQSIRDPSCFTPPINGWTNTSSSFQPFQAPRIRNDIRERPESS